MIYLSNNVHKQFCSYAKKHSFIECGAYLIGKRKPNSFREDDFVVLDIFICKEKGNCSEFVFSPDSQIKACKYINEKYEKCKIKPCIVGTIHSHAQHNAFFSSVDISTYKRFGTKTLCFIVYSPRYKKWVACSRNISKEIVTTNIEFIKNIEKINNLNEKLIVSYSTKDGKNKFEIFEEEYHETYYSSRLQNNKVIRFRTKANLSKEIVHRNEIRTLNSNNLLAGKRILIIGCGTIGSAITTPLKGCGITQITFVDIDQYELPNISRTNNIGFNIAAQNEKKAIALARSFVYQSSEDLLVNAISTDITTLGYGFIKNFDAVICLADNNVVRSYAAFASRLYKKWFLQAGTTVYNGDIIGQLSIQPPIKSAACFSCIEYASDFNRLIKRTGCSQLDADVSPQILSRASELASRLVDWTVALLSNRISLPFYKKICYFGVNNPNGESTAYNFTEKQSNCSLHKIFENTIPLISCVRDSISLYTQLKEQIFKTDGVYSIQTKESMLIYMFTDKKEIHNILLNSENKETLINYLPRDHIYCIDNYSDGDRKFVQIIFSE